MVQSGHKFGPRSDQLWFLNNSLTKKKKNKTDTMFPLAQDNPKIVTRSDFKPFYLRAASMQLYRTAGVLVLWLCDCNRPGKSLDFSLLFIWCSWVFMILLDHYCPVCNLWSFQQTSGNKWHTGGLVWWPQKQLVGLKFSLGLFHLFAVFKPIPGSLYHNTDYSSWGPTKHKNTLKQIK